MFEDVLDSLAAGTLAPEAHQRFDAMCKKIGSEGRGLSMQQIADCWALSLLLEEDEPDEEKVSLLTTRLELEIEGP